ncbi:tripartite tricarboxylate transporter TctB family protein [Virgibacillus phasianinus]|uniref:Tripartite tricarboxylate transporter TctB family protein n=1 Tax=Virgibacillus phasianinus TaxID=2017483 RepID=A0A220U4J9_9BACI|nr:tripartite tricarboxylate transporter TctB family protein [Virgibacillus phasianinus]ASK62653.1 tripartite tricarboxylate transporter TctB family protein [Virgibacillus phasianinus]
MKAFKIGMPVFLIIVSIVCFIGAIRLPKANLGDPYGPLYFPIGISVLLFIFGIVYFFQEIKRINKSNNKITELFTGRTPKLIGVTIILGIGYTLIFESLGFLIASILFLGALLFVVNGIKNWKTNIIVALAFSFISWYAFSELLGVSLP